MKEDAQITEMSELTGKTVERAFDSPRALVFTDGTFVVFVSYDDDRDVYLRTDPLGADEMFVLGFMSEADYQRHRDSVRAQYEEEESRRERALLARLKAKYEGSGGGKVK